MQCQIIYYFTFKHIRMIVNCHSCMIPGLKFKAKCCIPRCGKYYCIDCIKNKFDHQYQESTYNKDFWICYSCQKKCDCQLCNGLNFQRKRGRKKQNPQEKALKQAERNALRKVKSQMLQSSAKKKQRETEPIQQDPYDLQEINKEFPLIRKILLRKRMYYQMMKQQFNTKNLQKIQPKTIDLKKIEQMKQPQLPASRRQIEKLIGNTIKDYDQDEEELDIQILD